MYFQSKLNTPGGVHLSCVHFCVSIGTFIPGKQGTRKKEEEMEDPTHRCASDPTFTTREGSEGVEEAMRSGRRRFVNKKGPI
jgi:hypothetical protein